MYSLDVEGLFDFRVRSDEEMEDDEGRDEEIEENVWIIILANVYKEMSIIWQLPIPFILNPPDTVSECCRSSS